MVMPRSHVSIARFYDWSEETKERFSVSKLYRDIAHAPKIYPSEKGPPRQMSWCTNGVRLTPGRMFGRDKGALTKGEREIIEGICRNRGDLPRDGVRPELTARSHKEAWLVGKQIARPLFRGERQDGSLPDSFFIRSVDAANTPAPLRGPPCPPRPSCQLCELGLSHDRVLAIRSLENGVDPSMMSDQDKGASPHNDVSIASPAVGVTSEQTLTPDLTAWRQERSKTFMTDSSEISALGDAGTPHFPPPWPHTHATAPPCTPDSKLLPRRPSLNNGPGSKGRGGVVFKNSPANGDARLDSRDDLAGDGREFKVKDGKKKVTVNIYLPKMAAEATEDDLRHCLLQGRSALRKERPLSHSDFKAKQKRPPPLPGMGEALSEGCDSPRALAALTPCLPEKLPSPRDVELSPRLVPLDAHIVTAVAHGDE